MAKLIAIALMFNFTISYETSQLSDDSKVTEITNTILDARSLIGNFECQFEGTTGTDLHTPMIDSEIVTGTFLSGANSAYCMEVYKLSADHEFSSKDIYVVNAGETKIYRGPIDRPNEGAIELSHTNTGHFFIEGGYNQCFCLDWIISLLKYNDRRVRIKDTEIINKTTCTILEVSVGARADYSLPEGGVRYRFWVDLANFGQPLKIEIVDASENVQGRVSIEDFLEFAINGQNIKLPISSTFETFLSYNKDRKQITTTVKPTHRTIVKMVAQSVSDKGKLEDSAFRPNFAEGVPVSDRVRRLQYDFSSKLKQRTKKPSTRKETQEELLAKIELAQDQKQHLKNSNWQDGDSNAIASLLSWVFIIISAALLLVGVSIKIYKRAQS